MVHSSPPLLDRTEVSFADTCGLALPAAVEGAQEWTLSQVRDEEDLHRVGRFRYTEHVVRLRKPAVHAQHDRALLLEPLDAHSTLIVALDDATEVIGSVRVTLRPDFARLIPWMLPALASEPGEDASYVSRLLVADRFRGTDVAKQLFIAAFELGAAHAIQRCYIYCAPKLVKYYERWGFVPLKGVVHHPDDGEQLPMRLDIRDSLHLKRVRSPFSRHAAAMCAPLATDGLRAPTTLASREPCR